MGAAARCFDRALAAAPPDDLRARARLELQAGIGHFRDHDLWAAKRRLLEAVADAKTAGDVETWGAAALLVTRAQLTIGQSSIGSGVDTSMLEELLDAIEDEAPLTGQIVSLMSEIRFHAFDFDGGLTLLDEARRLARTMATTPSRRVSSSRRACNTSGCSSSTRPSGPSVRPRRMPGACPIPGNASGGSGAFRSSR